MKISRHTRTLFLATTLGLSLGSAQARDEPMLELERVSVQAQPAVNERSLRIAIIKAGARRNWTVEGEAPGEVLLKQNKANKHMAVVKVRYDSGSYQISYVSSHNLNEGAWQGGRLPYSRNAPTAVVEERRIHPTYNMWLRNLSSDIASEVGLLGLN